jgi:hypothetical protein
MSAPLDPARAGYEAGIGARFDAAHEAPRGTSPASTCIRRFSKLEEARTTSEEESLVMRTTVSLVSTWCFGIALLAGCASEASGDDPGSGGEAISSTSGKGAKPVREAIQVTCTSSGHKDRFDFFFDSDAQLRGTLLGSTPSELAVVKPADRTLDPLKSVSSDDTVLRGPSGPFYIVARFFPRFITDTDASFVASHSSIKVVSEQGAVTDSTCTPDPASDAASKVAGNILSMIPASEYKGHGATQAKLCSTVVEGSGSNVTVSIKPRSADGTLGTATSTFTLHSDSKMVANLTSAKGDVLYVKATTTDAGKTATRALVVDKADSATFRVSITSFGDNGGSTNVCDM